MHDVAVIGAGRIGSIHARNLAAMAGVRLAGIADADAVAAGRLAATCGTGVIGLDAAFGAGAVVIASPTPTHADFIERAAAAGCAVFCEKPIDLDAARVRACLAAATRASILLMVGFNRRFDPSFAALKATIAGGGIGRLELLSITSRDPAPPPAAYIRSSGGLFRDMTIHDFDMARFLLGEEPVGVHATASAFLDAVREAGDVDTAAITLRTGSGAIATITNSRRASYGYDQRIEAHGEAGLVAAGNRTATSLVHADRHGFRTDPALPFFLERYEAAYQNELATFIAALKGEDVAFPDGEDGLRALLIADAALESSRTGREVAL
ncbi:MAG: inositol 2-dehydrogenase [Rhodospirillales bacterium]|nr:inositol 2-dehydrogenase [Rhodospirillales bacterium]